MEGKIKSRMQEAKVYAVLFREDNTDKMFLTTFLAYSLDDVYETVRRQMPPNESWLPYMWHCVSIGELVRGAVQVISSPIVENKETVPDPKDLKNKLMKQIIDKKDRKLFEDSKIIFSEDEKKFIEDKLNDNGTETQQPKRHNRKR